MTTLYEEVEQEFACTHPDPEIRYKIDSLGRKHYVEQCMICGEAISSSIKHSNVADKESVLPFDQNLLDQRDVIKRARYLDLASEKHHLHQMHKSDWWQFVYEPYMNSPEWYDKRQRVLERDEYLCQACLKRKATQAHHLSYNHFGHEPLFELVAVCKVCHDALHEDGDDGYPYAEVSPVLSR